MLLLKLGALCGSGGHEFQDFSNEYINENGRLAVGGIALTDACGNLPCRYVIHAVSPRASEVKKLDDFTRILKNAYKLVIKCAVDHGFTSLGIPMLSAGKLLFLYSFLLFVKSSSA